MIMFHVFESSHTAGFSLRRRYGLMSLLRHFYVFASSGLPFFDCATYLGRYLMYGDIYCNDFTCISYTFPFLLGTLLLCYSVTLLPCYFVALLLCYLVTMLHCYSVILLHCYLVTLLPCYLVTCYLVTLLLFYLVTLYLVTPLPCYYVTLLTE